MYLTRTQRVLVDSKRMVRISYSPIFNKERTIGYAFKDKFYYRVRLDKSIEGNEKASMSVLIHELAHIDLGHLDESIREGIKEVFSIAEKLGISKDAIRLWPRGPMGVINICMDFEVNDKYLTRQNISDLSNVGFPPVTLEMFGIEAKDNWHEYIEPYLTLMKDKYNEFEQLVKDAFERMKDIGEMQTKRMKGSNSKSGNGGGNSSKPNKPEKGENGDKDSEGITADEFVDKAEDSEGSDGDEKEDKSKFGNDEESQSDSNQDDDVTDDDLEDDGEPAEQYPEPDEELGDLLTTSDDNENDHTSYGLSHDKLDAKRRPNKKSPSKILEEFFMQILGHEKVYTPDAMKHYNRGTRRNDHGLIYSSINRKVKLRPKKLGILIDVSGSMDSKSLLVALDSLEPLLHVLHKDSRVVLWDTEKCGEFPITKLPSKVSEGGGTDMASGLRYLTKKGFDTVVIYSDFDTSRSSLYHAAVDFNKDLSFIHVVNEYSKEDENDIIQDQKMLVRRVIRFNPNSSD